MFVVTHYARLSNVSHRHMIADYGSILDGDRGTMLGMETLLLDRLQYRYNVFHYSLSSLGDKISGYIKSARNAQLPIFGGGKDKFRVQPNITNLLSSNDTEYEYSLLPPVEVLNWDF